MATPATVSPGAYPAFEPRHVDEVSSALDGVLARGAITPVFQPVVDLYGGATVGCEALARGPRNGPLERPDRLFGAARAAGRLVELDWLCQDIVLGRALEAGLACPLFVNVEPEALGRGRPAHLADTLERASRELSIVVELTERALTARPADLLGAVARIRAQGWRLALDDVGADVRSLALMPLLDPDVIKLDLRLVERQPDAEIAEIAHAVNAQAERTGAVVLAEGIESEQHLATARALGATLGQGWLFGRPGPLPSATAPAKIARPARERVGVGTSPFEVVALAAATRPGDKRLLIAMSLSLERHARGLGTSGLILSAFQSHDRFTGPTRARYAGLASEAALVAALGAGMEQEPAPGVRGASLEEDDVLAGEWSVVVLGTHFAAALVAVDLGDDGPDMDRRFEFALTYDRDLVIAAAAAIIWRITPAGV